VNIKISGCQNGCGLHHIADFGFRGMGKKIGARNAPHYQIYIGGEERKNGHLALLGPVVPARLAKASLALLLDAYAAGKQGDESVRDWSLRLGKDGFRKLIEPIEKQVDPANEGLFFDFGEDWEFSPPAGRTAECAVATADDDVQKDLADDALISTDRALAAGLGDKARAAADLGFRYSAQRLRIRAMMPGAEEDNEETVISTVRTAYFGDAEVIGSLDGFLAAREKLAGPQADGQFDALREALALWQDTVEGVIARPIGAAAAGFPGFGSGLDDSAGSSVMDMIKGQ
jgi:sulfite reductase (NADPH) hemoprotein beta-component